MRIVFDQGTPAPLRSFLDGHEVATAAELGWSELENGAFLSAAEAQAFEILITTDQNLRYQQNLEERSVGVVVLMSTSWPRIKERVADVISAVNELPPGGYHVVDI